jgi:ATP synthase assembly factor FMC1, mitochondrial
MYEQNVGHCFRRSQTSRNRVKLHASSHERLRNNHRCAHSNCTMATPTKLRSLYRSFLRELPSRPLSEKSRSPLQARIRSTIVSESKTPIEQAEQFLQYVKAQRMYATLLERYNPGMGMDEEERVRLTARRVGMDLPDEFSYSGSGESSGSGNKAD